MRTFTSILFVVALGCPLASSRAEPGKLISDNILSIWRPRYGRIQEKILTQQRVRPPSSSAARKLLTAPANQAAARAGAGQLKALNAAAKAGGVKRGVRRGYSGTEVEYSGVGLAGRLGLRAGQSTTWATTGAMLEVKAESGRRVVLKVRRHDVFTQALRGAVDKIVAKLVADPSATLTAKEELRLSLAPTDLRAEAMASSGFRLERQTQRAGMKYRLHVTGEKQTAIFARVFGPSVSTYLPGSGHSQYIHSGLIFDTYQARDRVPLRSTKRTVYPVTLSLREALRLDGLAKAIVAGDDTVQGMTWGSNRPPGYWPPRPGVDCKTGNSCTTTHHRAPIGNRDSANAWLDELERGSNLLQRVSHKEGAARLQQIDAFAANAAIPARERELLAKLRPIVESYNKMGLATFPLGLLGRAQLKELLGVPFDPSRAGTTDPLGPGLAKGLYGGAPKRVPVIVELRPGA